MVEGLPVALRREGFDFATQLALWNRQTDIAIARDGGPGANMTRRRYPDAHRPGQRSRRQLPRIGVFVNALRPGQVVARPYFVSCGTGGWNAVDALDAMAPNEAETLINWFPRTTYNRLAAGLYRVLRYVAARSR